MDWMENASVTGVPNNRDRDRDADQERLTICVERIRELEATVARLEREKSDERARVIEVMRRVVDAHDTHAQRLGSYCMLYIVDEVTSALATERDEGSE